MYSYCTNKVLYNIYYDTNTNIYYITGILLNKSCVRNETTSQQPNLIVGKQGERVRLEEARGTLVGGEPKISNLKP